MRRLTVVLTLMAGHVHAAGVLPPWPTYAGQSFGSDNYWIEDANGVYQADDNSYMPALAGSCAGQPGC